jgi:cell division septal protein FtsQ
MPREFRARAAARPAPRPRAVQLVPSGRSVAVSLALAVLALLAYLGARETPVFAVRSIDVEGVRGGVARRVESALVPLEGTSLLKVNGAEVTRLATALPYVAGVTYDRAFPNTLRVRVETEQPLAVVRRGIEAWLVSRRGRATERIAQGTHRTLPRIWLPRTVDVALGATLGTGAGAEEVAMLTPLHEARLTRRVASVHKVDGQWVYMLRGGLELRVGTPSDLPLKLAIARRILTRTPVTGYLDVSVPDRPVAGFDPQVSGGA